jgi:putative Holliday junction resolvase
VATPLQTVARVGDRVVEHGIVAALAAEHEATVLVVGLPLSLSGEVGPAARQVLSEVRGLRKRVPIEVVTHDERLSTSTAEASLRQQGVGRRQGRMVVDSVAASVILQAWMDGRRA